MILADLDYSDALDNTFTSDAIGVKHHETPLGSSMFSLMGLPFLFVILLGSLSLVVPSMWTELCEW